MEPLVVPTRSKPPAVAVLATVAVLGIILTVAAARLDASRATTRSLQRPGAVVLMIGDGLGASQIALTRRALLAPGERLRLETLPVVGLMSTWSANNAVTDSGAAATALAAGQKTANRRVGMDSDGRVLRSITEEARARGWRVGYVTTTTITHATPAAFYAHVADRYGDESDIALQLLEHAPDVVLAGGLGKFLPESAHGERRDGRDLTAEAKARGYAVWTRASGWREALGAMDGSDSTASESLDGRSGSAGRAFEMAVGGKPALLPERLLGLFAQGHLAYGLDDRRLAPAQRDPSLVELTTLALAILGRDDKPFFLLVEGGRIDHAAHDFDPATAIVETAAFDQAVGEVIDYATRRPETLILVTADHATGGMALNDYVEWEKLAAQGASVDWLTRQLAHGGAGGELVAEMGGAGALDAAELTAIRGEEDGGDARRHLGRALSRYHGVTFVPRVGSATHGHTGEDVPFYAGGPGAGLFAGVLDNAEVPHLLTALLGWEGALSGSPPSAVEARLTMLRNGSAPAVSASH